MRRATRASKLLSSASRDIQHSLLHLGRGRGSSCLLGGGGGGAFFSTTQQLAAAGNSCATTHQQRRGFRAEDPPNEAPPLPPTPPSSTSSSSATVKDNKPSPQNPTQPEYLAQDGDELLNLERRQGTGFAREAAPPTIPGRDTEVDAKAASTAGGSEGYTPKQPAKSYFGRYADTQQLRREHMMKVQRGEVPPTQSMDWLQEEKHPDGSSNIDGIVPTQQQPGALGGLADDQENAPPKPPLARQENIDNINESRRRQRRSVLPSGQDRAADGSVRIKRPLPPGASASAAKDGAEEGATQKEYEKDDFDFDGSTQALDDQLKGGLRGEAPSADMDWTTGRLRYHKMNEKQLEDLTLQYIHERKMIEANMATNDGSKLSDKWDSDMTSESEDEKFQKKWGDFEKFMSSRKIEPLDMGSISPKLRSLIENNNEIHGWFTPGTTGEATRSVRTTPENSWYAANVGSKAYVKPIEDPIVAQRSIFQNLANLTEHQKEQIKYIFSDIEITNSGTMDHVVATYPYGRFLWFAFAATTAFLVFNGQIQFGAFGFYDEYFGFDFRRVPQMESPFLKVTTIFICFFFLSTPIYWTTIFTQRMFRILRGRPVGPP